MKYPTPRSWLGVCIMYTKTEEKSSPGSGLGVCMMYTKTEEKPSPRS